MQIESWWLNELLTHLLYNKVLDGRRNLVRSDTLKQDHLLEGIQLGIPVAWHRLVLGVHRVKDFFELDIEVDEILLDSFEAWNVFVHSIQLLVRLDPFKIVEPLGRIGLLFYLARRTSKEKAPLVHVNLVVSKEYLCAKQEREKQLVALEERATNVVVESEREVLV